MSDDEQGSAPSELQSAEDARVVLSTVPPGKAGALARTLIEERLAACVNLVPGLRSVYHWKGAVADDPETLMIIKTAAGRVDDLAARLSELHPYDVPEFLAFRPETGLSSYLGWIAKQASEA